MSAITERAQKPRISIRCQYKISNFSYTDNSNINIKLLQIASPAMLEQINANLCCMKVTLTGTIPVNLFLTQEQQSAALP